MSNIKELMSKTKSFIEWIFGAVVLVIAIFYGISNFSTSYEKDRIALAKDIFRKTLRIGLEFEGEKVTENMLDVIMTTVQNKNKAECENSTIYYAFSLDSELIWIKTEKSGDMISAEAATGKIPSNCTFYEKINDKWKQITSSKNTSSNNKPNNNGGMRSSCDGDVVNLSVDTGSRYGNDTIKVEIQSRQISNNRSMYSQRFCVKGNVLTLLMGEGQNFNDNEAAFHNLPQVHPQNIKCPKLIDWLNNYGGMTMGIDDNEEPLYLGGRIG